MGKLEQRVVVVFLSLVGVLVVVGCGEQHPTRQEIVAQEVYAKVLYPQMFHFDSGPGEPTWTALEFVFGSGMLFRGFEMRRLRQ